MVLLSMEPLRYASRLRSDDGLNGRGSLGASMRRLQRSRYSLLRCARMVSADLLYRYGAACRTSGMRIVHASEAVPYACGRTLRSPYRCHALYSYIDPFVKNFLTECRLVYCKTGSQRYNTMIGVTYFATFT
jgi:hypothetical protein